MDKLCITCSLTARASMQPVLRWLSNVNFRTLQRRIEALEGDFEQLQAQHKALRSTFYATRGRDKPPPGPPPGSREEKDAILRDHLFRRRNDDSSNAA